MPNIVIDIKRDNQGSITLIYNLVFHICTKHINIQHYYIRDTVIAGRIKLSFIPIFEIIANKIAKSFIWAKFYEFKSTSLCAK